MVKKVLLVTKIRKDSYYYYDVLYMPSLQLLLCSLLPLLNYYAPAPLLLRSKMKSSSRKQNSSFLRLSPLKQSPQHTINSFAISDDLPRSGGGRWESAFRRLQNQGEVGSPGVA